MGTTNSVRLPTSTAVTEASREWPIIVVQSRGDDRTRQIMPPTFAAGVFLREIQLKDFLRLRQAVRERRRQRWQGQHRLFGRGLRFDGFDATGLRHLCLWRRLRRCPSRHHRKLFLTLRVLLANLVDSDVNAVQLLHGSVVSAFRYPRPLRQGVYPVLLRRQRLLVLLQFPEAWPHTPDRGLADLRAPSLLGFVGLLIIAEGCGVIPLARVTLVLAPQDAHRCARQAVLLLSVQCDLVCAVSELLFNLAELTLRLRVLCGRSRELPYSSLHTLRGSVEGLDGVKIRPRTINGAAAVLGAELLVNTAELLQEFTVAGLCLAELPLEGVQLPGCSVHRLKQRRDVLR
mmetsp:Transcript_65430/g.182070  ORF Transcript_65430/g.182070 Transcript_65430/m.182070 type:complete len:345 (-) Transcript_65430:180-1214(-)